MHRTIYLQQLPRRAGAEKVRRAVVKRGAALPRSRELKIVANMRDWWEDSEASTWAAGGGRPVQEKLHQRKVKRSRAAFSKWALSLSNREDRIFSEKKEL